MQTLLTIYSVVLGSIGFVLGFLLAPIIHGFTVGFEAFRSLMADD